MIRWFLGLPKHRKVLLFLSGGMLTLVFDAFVPHFQWTRGSMKWNQWIPVIYGLAAFVALGLPALKQLTNKAENSLLVSTGLLGILVGNAGVYYHLVPIIEGLEGEESTFTAIGQVLKLSPPLFAPAAFAGIGLLLLVLKRLTSAQLTAAHVGRPYESKASAQVVAMGDRI